MEALLYRRAVCVSIAAAAGIVVSACSTGDHAVGPSGPMQTDTLMVAADQTGFVESGAGDAAFAAPGSDIRVGDDAAKDPLIDVRGFVGFDLSGLPSGIHVKSAMLVATQCSVAGSPFDLGNVVLDHISYTVPFDTTAYAVSPLASLVGTISTDTTLGARSVSVTSSVADDIGKGRSSSQFRLRMSTTNEAGNGPSNQVIFASDSANTSDCLPASGQQPRLVVTY